MLFIATALSAVYKKHRTQNTELRTQILGVAIYKRSNVLCYMSVHIYMCDVRTLYIVQCSYVIEHRTQILGVAIYKRSNVLCYMSVHTYVFLEHRTRVLYRTQNTEKRTQKKEHRKKNTYICTVF